MDRTARSLVLPSAIALTVLLVSTARANALERCNITFKLSTPTPVTVLQFRVDYSAAQGTIRTLGKSIDGETGSIIRPDCRALVEGTTLLATASCTDAYAECQWGENRTLSAVLTGSTEIQDGTDVVRCTYDAAQAPSAADIVVQLEDATNSAREYIDGKGAQVSIASIECAAR